MISVVPEEEEEDINTESDGEEGYEHENNGEYTDTEGEESLPEYTTADEGYQGREEESNGPHQDPPSSPVRRSNGSSGASRAISGEGTRPLGG